MCVNTMGSMREGQHACLGLKRPHDQKGRETWLIGIRTIWKLLVAWMLTVVMQPHKMSEDPHPYISRLTSHANWISTKLLYMYVCYILTS